MRVAVYSDLTVGDRDGAPRAGESFALFAQRLGDGGSVILVGREAPADEPLPFRLADGVEVRPLPGYGSLSRMGDAARSFRAASREFGRVLDEVDAVWLLGPHPLAIAFAVQARRRGKAVVLGVRQDLPAYTASRHPGNRPLQAAALGLEGVWRLLSRACPTVVVGPDLARRYRHAAELLSVSISLIGEDDVVSPQDVAARTPGTPFRLLSVGRLDAEKNPLMLADVLAALNADGPAFALTVAGDGSERAALAARLGDLGVAQAADLRGYVALGDGLDALYREADALLHVSWTEGVPQILQEAFAAGLPVVATAVGGVAEAVGDAGLLVGPGDPDAAATACRRLAGDPSLSQRLALRGLERARAGSAEAESGRVADLIARAVARRRR